MSTYAVPPGYAFLVPIIIGLFIGLAHGVKRSRSETCGLWQVDAIFWGALFGFMSGVFIAFCVPFIGIIVLSKMSAWHIIELICASSLGFYSGHYLGSRDYVSDLTGKTTPHDRFLKWVWAVFGACVGLAVAGFFTVLLDSLASK